MTTKELRRQLDAAVVETLSTFTYEHGALLDSAVEMLSARGSYDGSLSEQRRRSAYGFMLSHLVCVLNELVGSHRFSESLIAIVAAMPRVETGSGDLDEAIARVTAPLPTYASSPAETRQPTAETSEAP